LGVAGGELCFMRFGPKETRDGNGYEGNDYDGKRRTGIFQEARTRDSIHTG